MDFVVSDNERDCEFIFELNEDNNVTAINVYPGINSRVPKQRQEYPQPVPLVPNFIRIEAIISQNLLQPCRKNQVANQRTQQHHLPGQASEAQT